jgi:hypothetical protein
MGWKLGCLTRIAVNLPRRHAFASAGSQLSSAASAPLSLSRASRQPPVWQRTQAPKLIRPADTRTPSRVASFRPLLQHRFRSAGLRASPALRESSRVQSRRAVEKTGPRAFNPVFAPAPGLAAHSGTEANPPRRHVYAFAGSQLSSAASAPLSLSRASRQPPVRHRNHAVQLIRPADTSSQPRGKPIPPPSPEARGDGC